MSQDEDAGVARGLRAPGPGVPVGRPVPADVARHFTMTPQPRRVAPSPQQPRGARPPTSLVRVVLCEDRELFRVGLRVVLEGQPDIAVVAETSQLRGALAATDDLGAQVVVVRQGLVSGTALPLLRDLCRRGTAVLVLAEPGAESAPELVDVLQAGVRGYLPRRAAGHRMVEGVRALARHEAALDASATSQLVHHLTESAARQSAGLCALDRLTDRQRDVAGLVAQGLSNEEIAQKLFLSLATVKSHLTASMRRLGVRTRTQLAILVARDCSPAA